MKIKRCCLLLPVLLSGIVDGQENCFNILIIPSKGHAQQTIGGQGSPQYKMQADKRKKEPEVPAEKYKDNEALQILIHEKN